MKAEPVIITGLAIEDKYGENRVSYNLTVNDDLTLDNEATESVVEDGMTIKDWTSATLEIKLYDLDVLDDSRVGVGSTIPPRSTIVLTTVMGEIQLYDVRIRGYKVRDLNRGAAFIKATVNDSNGLYNNGIGINLLETTFIVQ